MQPSRTPWKTRWLATLRLKVFCWFKIPLLAYISPRVEEIDAQRCVIRIPLRRRTRNHLRSMYFGVLAAGADCAAGLLAVAAIRASGQRISFIFKDFSAEFLKRVEGDCLFTCEAGEAIAALVQRVVASGQREHLPVEVIATVPAKLGAEPVAQFRLTLSLKLQQSEK